MDDLTWERFCTGGVLGKAVVPPEGPTLDWLTETVSRPDNVRAGGDDDRTVAMRRRMLVEALKHEDS